MSERAPYSRVYWTVRNDLRLTGIYSDDHHWATWNRLLLAADMAWPAPADLPANARRASLRALEAAGVIELLPGGLFCFHGLDTERGRRSSAATASAKARWTQSERAPDALRTHPKRIPNGMLDETRRDETSRDDAREISDGRTDLEAFLVITRRAPTVKQRRLLDDVLDRHDLTGPAWAADIMYRHPDDPIGAVIEADTAYRAERIAAAQAAEKPKPQPRRPRGLPQTTRDIMAEMALLRGETA
jgi:hypothetical protein